MKIIDKPTRINAINHERIHIIKKLPLNILFTDTIIKVTKKVVMQLITIANLISDLTLCIYAIKYLLMRLLIMLLCKPILPFYDFFKIIS